MTNNTASQNLQEIPYGYCHCGCGQLTTISIQSSTKYGYVRGEPKRFIIGHRSSLGVYQSAEVPFWKNVTPGNEDDCWEWQGPMNSSGYGLVQWLGNPRQRAHRVSYILHYGDIPEGILVLHRCDNRKCVNPAHLFLGDIAANMKDKVSKGRHLRGETIPSAKLTEDKVRNIREMASNGYLQKEIAVVFGMSRTAITNIVNRKRWRHVE